MIHVSDNDAATQAYDFVGDPGLYDVANRAGMRNFSVAGFWGNACSARPTRRGSSSG